MYKCRPGSRFCVKGKQKAFIADVKDCQEKSLIGISLDNYAVNSAKVQKKL